MHEKIHIQIVGPCLVYSEQSAAFQWQIFPSIIHVGHRHTEPCSLEGTSRDNVV